MRFGWEKQVTVQRWGSTWDSCRGERLSSVDGRLRETLDNPSPPDPKLLNYPSIHPAALLAPVWCIQVELNMWPLVLHHQHQPKYSPLWQGMSHHLFFVQCTKKMQVQWHTQLTVFQHYLSLCGMCVKAVGDHSGASFVFLLVLPTQIFLHHPGLLMFLIKLFFLNSLTLTHRSCLQASNCHAGGR